MCRYYVLLNVYYVDIIFVVKILYVYWIDIVCLFFFHCVFIASTAGIINSSHIIDIYWHRKFQDLKRSISIYSLNTYFRCWYLYRVNKRYSPKHSYSIFRFDLMGLVFALLKCICIQFVHCAIKIFLLDHLKVKLFDNFWQFFF